MIWDTLFNFLFDLVIAITGLFAVTLEGIPYIGTEIVSILSTMTGLWNSFMETFPYADTAWTIFLYVIIPFEISLLVLKFFLAHRVPAHV